MYILILYLSDSLTQNDLHENDFGLFRLWANEEL